ncbi:hypothetical protein OF117_16230 [Geodermatophilus sp. YIM 151500]|uniref:hypothetical protein n=1 Tax=Geodermatophilus sp. YIM 151500 TaxID=2984531 RepID=UPI0021E3F1EA|nr:hypothetical protein [Geodermatophilus sp. YIM 151500]MCV2490903.1 hypothetical protein [Geodermatophilus sp. YIM 151500]
MWSLTNVPHRRAVRAPSDPGPAARVRAPAAAVPVLVLVACAGPTVEPGPTIEQVELGPRIEQMLQAGPGRDSSAYRTLGDAENGRLADAVLAGLEGGEEPPLPDGTQALEAVDGSDRPVRVVAEDLDGGELRGLGLYAVRDGAGVPPRLVVEVPHPRADRRTEDLGPELFTALDADALFVAGAHRTAGDDAADVAHERDSAFAAVDRAVVGRGTVVLQVHGFDDSDHEGAAQVVLSSGKADPDPLVRDLDAALQDAGVETCVYDGKRCQDLAGTTNVQAAHAHEVGATFVHLELAPDLREEGADRDRLVDVLAEVLTR